VNAKQEAIATLRRHKAQSWAARSGKATNRATQSWVSGARANTARNYGKKAACDSWNKIVHNQSVAALRVVIRITDGEASK
jgi:hypothetical protein